MINIKIELAYLIPSFVYIAVTNKGYYTGRM